MKKTKKEIKEFLEAGKLKNLCNYIISDGTKLDIIDALKMMFDLGGEEYEITFESLPYSRGGRYARHTSTLHSTQSWFISIGITSGIYFIDTKTTSNSAACPAVKIPMFYTEKGRIFHNSIINDKIEELKTKLL